MSYDVALYIKNFVKTKKWFRYEQLTCCIEQFKFKGNDLRDKPCALKDNAEKLCGHAIQNWNFLRFLPIFMREFVDKNDVWQLLLKLKKIVDFVCAPQVSINQLSYLQVCIEEYLQQRQDLAISSHQAET